MTWGNYKQLNPHLPNPQSIAVAKRDTNVLSAVKGSLGHGRTALVFQPVVQARGTNKIVFFE